MTGKTLTAEQIFGDKVLEELAKVEKKQAKNFEPIIRKYLDDINKNTDQENDVGYLSYLAEYLFSKVK